MIRNILMALVCGSMMTVQAQGDGSARFCSPFDFPLQLSANFGELRPNHFHNGLDIKTQGVVGKSIHSVADGYVSRILVSHGGYGQALFITHPNGYTSVYGHVVSFAPQIQKYLREYQYEHETFVCDVRLDKDQIKVKAGDVVALSGNEGSSAGPHLHLELRRNDNGDYVDPMPFFRGYLKDTKAPVASVVGLYPVTGKGAIDGSGRKKIVSVNTLSKGFTAWGTIYTGIAAKDYMDGTSNFYGVHSVTLYVDSVQVFRSVTDEVSADENRMINGFTDYEELMNSRRLIMRSHKLPGNKLRLLHTGEERGLVTIDKERDYHFMYVLEDNFGNSRRYRFTVRGHKLEIPKQKPDTCKTLYWDKVNVIQEPGMELVVPRGMLYDNAKLHTAVARDSSRLSFEYTLDAGHTPLHGYCKLSIGIRNHALIDSSKYYIQNRVGKWKSSVGGKYERGWMKADIRQWGHFSVAVDTVAPKVVPIGQNLWYSRRDIRFRVSDEQTGIASYKVLVDGKFVLFALKKGILVIQDPERIRKGVSHIVEVIVADNCGNITRKQYKF